jgi:hypothetical protein
VFSRARNQAALPLLSSLSISATPILNAGALLPETLPSFRLLVLVRSRKNRIRGCRATE